MGEKMAFGISLKDQLLTKFDEVVLLGEVEIDGYKESFFAPVEYWSRADYLRSWKRALAEGFRDGAHAVLVTSMRNSLSCNFVFYWVVFLEGDKAYIQNGVIFIDELSEPFAPHKINSYVSAR
ncbi:hypothetical protein ACXIUT_04985 [Achromobacter denitrificans]